MEVEEEARRPAEEEACSAMTLGDVEGQPTAIATLEKALRSGRVRSSTYPGSSNGGIPAHFQRQRHVSLRRRFSGSSSSSMAGANSCQ